MAPPTAATARGVCAGALGGAIAGALDYALARAGASQFLPDGSLRLLGFLAALYGGVGAVSGGVAGLLLALLGRATDLGPLAEAAFRDRAAEPHPGQEGARVAAYTVALLVGLALLGGCTWIVTLNALSRFHGHLLIAALVGAVSAGLAIALAPGVFLVAALLSPVLRFGPRARLRFAAPAGFLAGFWTLGLLLAAATVLRLVDVLELRPRVSHELCALNTALWAPALVAAALGIAHVAGRWSARLLRLRPGAGLLSRPAGALLFPALLLAAGAAGAIILSWPTAKLLPWKPFVAGAAGLFAGATAALLGAGARFDGRGILLRAATVALVPLALLAIGLRVGGAERVRKAAITHAGLAGPLITALQLASDLDRDGYASLLGSDCDDWNPEVHPGVFDWPDDGIDQDCNGHEATATPRPRPPFAALPDAVPKKPNVILITIDAVRADHVGAYGYPRATTPNIDALAREGVLFKNGWAHSPSTRYSVPAILSGRYESTIAWGSPAVHWPPPVLPENRLLAEMFKEHGYRTGGFLPLPNRYCDRGWGIDQGMDDWDCTLETLHTGGDPARTTGSSSQELADLGIAWIGAHKAEPLFLWMHFYDPHYFYENHKEITPFGESDLDRYDGELKFTDLHVGRVIEALKAQGLWDRSVVIVSSDHGEGLGEHGISQHGYHIYIQQHKVPYIVRVPGIAPRVVEEPVGHVDLFPSLLNLLRAPDEAQLFGRSFVDLMLPPGTGTETETETETNPERVVFGEVEYEGPVIRKSVATRDWHLIANVVPAHTFELYHIAEDPEEAHDLAGNGLAEEVRLRGALAAWMDESALPTDFAARVTGNLSPSPLPFASPIGAEIGGLLAIDGADVKSPLVRPGDPAEVAVVMHPLKAIPAGWKMFTHFTAQNGRFINADHQPVENFVPLQKLRPGQWARDRIRVQVPPGWPAGPLTVEIGLFKGGERAPVKSGGDKVVVATLQVEPAP
ncbi:MAG: hypothetical protein EXR72_13700 [Myxococcales bacterium]|nr:hypothetical protein [Myxococcales bacterium]